MKLTLSLILAACSLPLAAQAPFISSAQNYLNSGAGVCPGAYIQVTWSEASNATQFAFQVGTEGAPVFGYVQTAINGIWTGIAQIELPWDLPVGVAPLTITTISASGTQTSVPFEMVTGAYCPSIGMISSSYLGYGGTATPFTQTAPAHPGDAVFMLAEGLGPTTPASYLGGAHSEATATLPVVTIDSTPAQVLSSHFLIPNANSGAEYEVVFVIPSSFAAGTTAAQHSLQISIAGNASPKQQIWIGPVPSGNIEYPKILAVQNAGSYLVNDTIEGIAPNSFASAYVANLGNVTSPANIFPATTYQGIQLLINGIAVPLYNLTTSNSITQITFATPPPPATLPKTYSIVVQSQGQVDPLAGDAYMVAVLAASPGLFRIPDIKTPTQFYNQSIAAQIAGTLWDVMPASLAVEYGLPSCAGLAKTNLCGQPAHPGDSIVIYLTGSGLATPNGTATGQPLAAGAVAPVDGSVLYETVVTPVVTLGSSTGIPATVTFSGIVPGTASLYQLNVTLPASFTGAFQPNDNLPLIVTTNGYIDQATIAVANP